MISHDNVWCMQGEPYDPAFWDDFAAAQTPLHFLRNVAPQPKERGMTVDELDLLTRRNPLRYFSKE